MFLKIAGKIMSFDYFQTKMTIYNFDNIDY